ncbi:hypothetical protein NBRC110019_25510 [Neptunitalea chrysea]|uniref:Por secretion system C-terminal sorting domain-containing protein n=2 Tax=Neptunitalea chrysea TaxID=1647581 RepID=A0A9W6EUH4_9FLAO|nr:hypothetical protein NBRC110019_25510 [Neptunitalea chrysea]
MALTVLLVQYSNAQLTYEVGLREQLDKAVVIVEGKVLDSKGIWDANYANIYTVHTVQVSKVYKGKNVVKVKVITAGGSVGLEAETVSPSLSLNKLDYGIFMLIPSDLELTENFNEDVFYAYSDLQGYYQFDAVTELACNSVKQYSIEGLTADINKFTGKQGIGFRTFGHTIGGSFAETPDDNFDALAINGVAPQFVTAGTQSAITISGSGFGSNKGQIRFKDADTGGNTTYAALDSQIISWSNNEIKVEVPTRAGDGVVQVVRNNGTAINSSETLNVNYAETTILNDVLSPGLPIAYPNQHINDNGTGGYEFMFSSMFAMNTDAVSAFTKAMNIWTCQTDMNWKLGGTSTIDATSSDGVNVVRFDADFELPVGILGRTTVRSSGCYVGSTLQWYVSEIDLRFDDGAYWYFGNSEPSSSQYDFESIALHELGHGRLLSHVINTNEVMHYNLGQGEVSRVLSAYDVDCGNDIHARSISGSYCSQPSMTNKGCTYGIDKVDTFMVDIYPNPATNKLFISNDQGKICKQVSLYDVNGRLVIQVTNSSKKDVNIMGLNSVTKGIYMLKLEFDDTVVIRKVLVE